MPLDEQSQSLDHEISLIDIVLFLRRSWRTIALFGLGGLICAFIYLWVTPSQYEANTLIQMSKITSPQNPLGINAEEPAVLIARMGSATSFDAAVISACGLEQSPNAGNILIKSVKLTIPKGLASVVELKVTRGSEDLAKTCAQSIFDQISASQALLSNPTKKAIKARLAIVQDRLEQDKVLLAKLDVSKNAVSSTYFAVLSEKRALEDEQDTLAIALSDGGLIATQMQYPMEVGAKPVYPKKSLSLLAGVIGGVFFGLLIVLGRQLFGQLGLELARKQSDHA
jgi:uncharacterized protein involved in exopolysaccharide biosynthesis